MCPPEVMCPRGCLSANRPARLYIAIVDVPEARFERKARPDPEKTVEA